MIGITRTRRAAALVAASSTLVLSLAAFLLGACAKKITRVEASFVPEGVPSPAAQMIVWYEMEGETLVYADNPPSGPLHRIDQCNKIQPGPEDTFLGSGPYSRNPPGTINGVVLDATPTARYQIYRRELNGGFHTVNDFTITPDRRWIGTQWEMYRFNDFAPSGFAPPTYLGRGLVGNVATPTGTLTNPALAHQNVIGDIQITGTCAPVDSLFTLNWSSVAGAFRYWVHVYRPAGLSSVSEVLASSLPGPIDANQRTDIFVGYVDTLNTGGVVQPPSTTYRMGDFSRRDVKVIQSRGINFGFEYYVRITAIDSLGQVLAYTRGDYNQIPEEGRYKLFRRGAYLIIPSHPGGLAAESRPSAWAEERARLQAALTRRR